MSDASEQTREYIEQVVESSEALLVDAEDGAELGVVDPLGGSLIAANASASRGEEPQR